MQNVLALIYVLEHERKLEKRTRKSYYLESTSKQKTEEEAKLCQKTFQKTFQKTSSEVM